MLEVTLPRLAFPEAQAGDPFAAFPQRPRALWLEVGFGGGEHALAQIAAHPDIGLIACEPFENGICSLLSRLVPEGGEADAPLPPNLLLWPDDARVLLRRCRTRAWTGCSCCSPIRGRRRATPSAGSCIPRCCRCWRACWPGAEWRVATDDPTYQAWVTEVMAAQDLFDAPPPAMERPAGWPPTRYEAKALREGRSPLYWTLRRR